MSLRHFIPLLLGIPLPSNSGGLSAVYFADGDFTFFSLFQSGNAGDLVVGSLNTGCDFVPYPAVIIPLTSLMHLVLLSHRVIPNPLHLSSPTVIDNAFTPPLLTHSYVHLYSLIISLVPIYASASRTYMPSYHC